MTPIPFLDLARLHESIRTELDAAFDRTLRSNAFIGGAELAAFEHAFARAHGVAAGVGVGSGTDALALALRALGIGPGDDVVVPAMTYAATAEAVAHVGAMPVLADVDPTTLLLTPEAVDDVLAERVRAVIPVHLYGHMVPRAHLEQWQRQGLVVIEDAAQAHLATSDGTGVGHVGHAACFSFYPGKNLGALGDGGMVLSKDPAVVAEVRRIGDHGRTTKYEHEVIGWCSRLDGLQAALLQVKLRHLPEWTAARRSLAEHYRTCLEGTPVRLVPWSPGAVHHLVVARLGRDLRDHARDTLAAKGIETGIHYPVPLSRQPSLKPAWRPCPAAELAAQEMLSLPIDPLMAFDEVERVCEAIVALAGS